MGNSNPPGPSHSEVAVRAPAPVVQIPQPPAPELLENLQKMLLDLDTIQYRFNEGVQVTRRKIQDLRPLQQRINQLTDEERKKAEGLQMDIRELNDARAQDLREKELIDKRIDNWKAQVLNFLKEHHCGQWCLILGGSYAIKLLVSTEKIPKNAKIAIVAGLIFAAVTGVLFLVKNSKRNEEKKQLP